MNPLCQGPHLSPLACIPNFYLVHTLIYVPEEPHILRVLSRTLKKTMVCLANLKNPRIFNDSQTQLRHHSYEVPSKSAGHLRPECASLTTCTNDGKAKRQQALLPNTLLFPGEAGSDPGLTPRCPDPLSQTFCFVRSKFLGRCLDSV